jgi:predicted transcriptional regulator
MSAATQHPRIVIVTAVHIETSTAYVTMVGDIVSAYISNNHVAVAELPALIASVHSALTGLVNGTATPEVTEPKGEKPTPAQIRKSVTRDAVISFIDGKGYKTLKRHLTVHGLTPDTYRARFGLPSDYPMVAAAYSEVRSGLAKTLGLGVQNGRRIEGEETVATSKGRKTAA